MSVVCAFGPRARDLRFKKDQKNCEITVKRRINIADRLLTVVKNNIVRNFKKKTPQISHFTHETRRNRPLVRATVIDS